MIIKKIIRKSNPELKQELQLKLNQEYQLKKENS